MPWPIGWNGGRGVDREEFNLDSLVKVIQRVATRIIHGKQLLEVHTYVVKVVLGLR